MIDLRLHHQGPIYEELKNKLRVLLISGSIEQGEQLPSVREIAAQLSINPNTIQRAYRELETEGYVYSIPGKGTFAADGQGDGMRRRKLLSDFNVIVQELLFLGVSKEELAKKILQGEEETV